MKYLFMALALLFTSQMHAKRLPIGGQVYLGGAYLPILASDAPVGGSVSIESVVAPIEFSLQFNMWDFAISFDIPFFLGSEGVELPKVSTYFSDGTKSHFFVKEIAYITIKYYPTNLHLDWMKWYTGVGVAGLKVGPYYTKSDADQYNRSGVIQLGAEIPLVWSQCAFIDIKKSFMSIEYDSITIEQPWYISAGLTWAIGKRSWRK
jgi:hypothetical protein